MKPDQETHRMHPLFLGLENKKLFIAEVASDTRYHIVEEARGMQKMKVTESTIAPIIDGQHVSLQHSIEGKNFDFLVFPLHPFIVGDIQQNVTDNRNVILLIEGSPLADPACDAAYKRWSEQKIPMINKDEHKKDLPFTLMKTMDAMLSAQN